LAGERPDATETAAVRLRPVIHAKECVGFFFGQAQRGSSVYISTKRPSIAEGVEAQPFGKNFPASPSIELAHGRELLEMPT